MNFRTLLFCVKGVEEIHLLLPILAVQVSTIPRLTLLLCLTR